MKPDVIVVGAGLAGAAIAERSAGMGYKVLVIEQRDHIAGNCFDYKAKNGITVQKYGPHIFHTKNEEVWKYLSNFTEWIPYKHKVSANLDGKIVSLPVSFKTIDQLFDKKPAAAIKNKLISLYGLGNMVPINALLEVEDEDIKNFASIVFEKIFLNYSKKQWGVNPLDLDPQVLSRLPIRVDHDDNYFKDPYQGIPKDGYTQLVANMLNNQNIEILLNSDPKDIIGDMEYKRLFYTGPIDSFFNFKFGELPYRALRFDFETLDTEWFQSNSVVNYPGSETFTRITEFKHFNGVICPNTVILREFPESFEKNKNFPAYPIPKDENHLLYKKYLEEADKLEKVTFAGRLGEYRYYNMDEVVLNSMQLTAIFSEN